MTTKLQMIHQAGKGTKSTQKCQDVSYYLVPMRVSLDYAQAMPHARNQSSRTLNKNSGLAGELPIDSNFKRLANRTGIASGELVRFATSATSGLGVALPARPIHFIDIDIYHKEIAKKKLFNNFSPGTPNLHRSSHDLW